MEPITNSRLSKSTNFVLGEKWGGLGSFQAYLKSNGVRTAPTTTLTAVFLQWRKSFDPKAPIEFEIHNGAGIVIDDATLWRVTIAEQTLNPPASGKYVWTLGGTTNGDTHAWAYGDTIVHDPFLL